MLTLGIAAVMLMGTTANVSATPMATKETKAEKTARMAWWKHARFGMFIHWGLYSVAAGEWNGKKDYAEWLMEEAHIPVDTYEKFVGQFNPVKFDANAWAKMAKDAGMQYVVITTKHHDGFALFDSKVSKYTIMATPYKHDIMKELSTAVRAQGLTMGWYHSIMDWHSPLYIPARPWNPRAGKEKNLDDYNKYLRSMVTELLTNYGPIGVMWFDGEWESTWSDKYGKPLYDLCRKLQPNVIVNNRVSNSREGSMEDAGSVGVGDYATPEQYIPPTGLPGVYWETCMTMNDHWGYNKNDHDWKSSEQLVRNLVDIVSKGGNYLLNIGPRADGTFPPEAVERLHDIGQWMHVNGDSIYGTDASVFDGLTWGRSTTKRHGDGTTLYLQVFDWPSDDKLVVPGIGNDAVSAKLLAGGSSLDVTREGPNLVVSVPAEAPDKICSVVALEVKGAPIIYRAPKVMSPTDILVDSVAATIDSGSKDMQVRYTLDGTDPTTSSTLYTGPISIDRTVELKAGSFFKGALVSPVVSQTFTKVEPKPAATVAVVPGLNCQEFTGDFDKCADFEAKTPEKTFVATNLDYPVKDGAPVEHVGRVYEAYLPVPEDGVYTFALTSDDGARLWVDGDLAVDHDGAHSPSTKTGSVALAKGLHKIRIAWFNKGGGAELKLDWGKAGAKLLPATGFGHD